jgi:hypothetical protein
VGEASSTGTLDAVVEVDDLIRGVPAALGEDSRGELRAPAEVVAVSLGDELVDDLVAHLPLRVAAFELGEVDLGDGDGLELIGNALGAEKVLRAAVLDELVGALHLIDGRRGGLIGSLGWRRDGVATVWHGCNLLHRLRSKGVGPDSSRGRPALLVRSDTVTWACRRTEPCGRAI